MSLKQKISASEKIARQIQERRKAAAGRTKPLGNIPAPTIVSVPSRSGESSAMVRIDSTVDGAPTTTPEVSAPAVKAKAAKPAKPAREPKPAKVKAEKPPKPVKEPKPPKPVKEKVVKPETKQQTINRILRRLTEIAGFPPALVWAFPEGPQQAENFQSAVAMLDASGLQYSPSDEKDGIFLHEYSV